MKKYVPVACCICDKAGPWIYCCICKVMSCQCGGRECVEMSGGRNVRAALQSEGGPGTAHGGGN